MVKEVFVYVFLMDIHLKENPCLALTKDYLTYPIERSIEHKYEQEVSKALVFGIKLW